MKLFKKETYRGKKPDIKELFIRNDTNALVNQTFLDFPDQRHLRDIKIPMQEETDSNISLHGAYQDNKRDIKLFTQNCTGIKTLDHINRSLIHEAYPKLLTKICFLKNMFLY